MLGILEAELVGHLVDSQLLVCHVLLREVDDLVLDVALSRESCLFLDEVAEITWREKNLLCEVGYRGQPLALGLATAEIRLQIVLETGHNVAVRLVAGDELAVVIAHAVVEQQAYGIGDKALRVLVV